MTLDPTVQPFVFSAETMEGAGLSDDLQPLSRGRRSFLDSPITLRLHQSRELNACCFCIHLKPKHAPRGCYQRTASTNSHRLRKRLFFRPHRGTSAAKKNSGAVFQLAAYPPPSTQSPDTPDSHLSCCYSEEYGCVNKASEASRVHVFGHDWFHLH